MVVPPLKTLVQHIRRAGRRSSAGPADLVTGCELIVTVECRDFSIMPLADRPGDFAVFEEYGTILCRRIVETSPAGCGNEQRSACFMTHPEGQPLGKLDATAITVFVHARDLYQMFYIDGVPLPNGRTGAIHETFSRY